METKVLEIRDRMTCISALGICMEASETTRPVQIHLRRAGYAPFNLCILLGPLDGGTFTYDPYSQDGRTWKVAHEYVEKNWRHLVDGDVVDVEFILGETASKKVAEVI